MPDYKNEPAGIEKLLPWSVVVKHFCNTFGEKIVTTTHYTITHPKVAAGAGRVVCKYE